MTTIHASSFSSSSRGESSSSNDNVTEQEFPIATEHSLQPQQQETTILSKQDHHPDDDDDDDDDIDNHPTISHKEPINVTRYNVAASHCFLYMTWTQVFLQTLKAASRLKILCNIAFHVVYTVLYIGFLLVYVQLRIPISFYTSDVTLYTAGYATFEVYFWQAWLERPSSTLSYQCGSLLFLVGSVGLVWGTFSWRQWYKFWHHSTALGNGSMSFLLGSILFTMDSFFNLPSSSSSHALVSTGLAIFAIGRVFFLYGCTNDNCNAFFLPKTKTLEPPSTSSNPQEPVATDAMDCGSTDISLNVVINRQRIMQEEEGDVVNELKKESV